MKLTIGRDSPFDAGLRYIRQFKTTLNSIFLAYSSFKAKRKWIYRRYIDYKPALLRMIINGIRGGLKMISIKRLNNKEFWLNPHLIETIEATPDTVITLSTGKQLIIKEPVTEVVAKIIKYRKTIGEKFFEFKGTT